MKSFVPAIIKDEPYSVSPEPPKGWNSLNVTYKVNMTPVRCALPPPPFFLILLDSVTLTSLLDFNKPRCNGWPSLFVSPRVFQESAPIFKYSETPVVGLDANERLTWRERRTRSTSNVKAFRKSFRLPRWPTKKARHPWNLLFIIFWSLYHRPTNNSVGGCIQNLSVASFSRGYGWGRRTRTKTNALYPIIFYPRFASFLGIVAQRTAVWEKRRDIRTYKRYMYVTMRHEEEKKPTNTMRIETGK